MESVIKESDGLLDKIKLIENFISLHLRRDQIEPQIRDLAKKTEDVKTLIQQCNHVMKVEYTAAMQEYKLIMRKMQEQQLQIINILIERKKCQKPEENSNNLNLIYKGCRTPQNVLKEIQPKSTQRTKMGNPSILVEEDGASKMFLGEYLQSPFVRKTRPLPVPFKFLDFEIKITSSMFESIPKYMRGRETLEELINFLDTTVVPCFNEKYQLLHRHRDCIRNHVDLDLWKIFKDQASYFPGQNFITQGDISRKIKKMLDKKSQNKITMLRHLGILQEQRKAQTVCYVWTANNLQYSAI